MIRVYNKVKKFKKQKRNGDILAQNRGKGVSVLTGWSLPWIKQYICYLSKILHILHKNGYVSLFGVSSFPCEVTFAMLRVLSRYNHSLDMARVVLKNQKVLEYIDYTLG